MIHREPAAAAERTFDLIVIGAGIYGAAAALHAARRGLSVLVIDRGDFGGETSWNSLRVLHGGLRYLQTLDLARFRESVRARSWFVREFPTLVDPLPCLMPLYGKGLRRTAFLRPVLALNERLRKLWSVPAELDLIPGGRVLTVDAVRQRFPGVRSDGLRGGALWYDGYLRQPQRVLIEMLRRATAWGAVPLNYVEATGWIVNDGQIGGVEVVDRILDKQLSMRSRAVLNCAGPWAGQLAGWVNSTSAVGCAPSLAFNLLLDRPLASEVTVAVEPAGGGRTYFLHPIGRRTLAGTYHCPASAPGTVPTDKQVLDFLGDLSAAVLDFEVTSEDVLRILPGTLPATHPGTTDLKRRAVWRDEGDDGGPDGLFTLIGVKYTTAPVAAERAINRIIERCFSRIAGEANGDDVEPQARYVPEWPEFVCLSQEDPSTARRLVRTIIEEESVTSMDDLLLRRSDWGLVPSEHEKAADLVRDLCPEGLKVLNLSQSFSPSM